MTVNIIKSAEEFSNTIKDNKIVLIHFYAPWAQQCDTINAVVEELAKLPDYKDVKFAKCEAEELPKVSLQYKIAAVPTVLIFSDGSVSNTINGANAPEISQKLNAVVGKIGSTAVGSGDQPTQSLNDRLKALVNKSKVMVFMKGNPQQPKCGFSRTLVGILNETKVPYETFDILEDQDVRQGLKTYSNWPTYPQIYVNGTLVGGLDIIKELLEVGELMDSLQDD